jgi:prepilin-type N-terminal cleavage/methylation domain-containing protein
MAAEIEAFTLVRSAAVPIRLRSRPKPSRLASLEADGDARAPGFTLVELLVVVAIIVVLLAMMAPALERAIEQAELAVCAAHLRGAGSGAFVYAGDNRRHYFYRPAVHETGIGYYQPRNLNVPFNISQTKNIQGYDDRPMMAPYFRVNILQCPLAGKVTLDDSPANSYIFGSYSLWMGWKYDASGQNANNPIASTGMFRLGDKLGYNGFYYPILAGDVIDTLFAEMSNAHPDSNGALAMRTYQADPNAVGGEARQNMSQNSTRSEWWGNATQVGRFDWNFLWDDGSVRRLDRARWNTGNGNPNGDPRVAYVPSFKDITYSIVSTLTIPKVSP